MTPARLGSKTIDLNDGRRSNGDRATMPLLASTHVVPPSRLLRIPSSPRNTMPSPSTARAPINDVVGSRLAAIGVQRSPASLVRNTVEPATAYTVDGCRGSISIAVTG